MASKKNTEKTLAKTVLIIYLIIYCALIVPTFINLWAFPVYRCIAASNWKQVECNINTISVQSDRTLKEARNSSSQRLYKINVAYDYQFSNQSYKSNDYSFYDFYTGLTIENLRKTVKQYQQQKITYCFVNPTNPNQVVLTRTISTDLINNIIISMYALCTFFGIKIYRHHKRLTKK